MPNGQQVVYISRALTPTECMHKLSGAVVRLQCERFDAYIYERESIHVETDHQPLETIAVKPLNSAPQRLQRMLLRLQKYNLRVSTSRKIKCFLLTLSVDHTCLTWLPVNSQNLEYVDHTASLALGEDCLQRVKHTSADDVVLQVLRKTITSGWTERCFFTF